MALFGKEKEATRPMARQIENAPVSGHNMIGQGTVIEGKLHTKTDMHISGKVVGELKVGGKLHIATDGVVEGDVSAAHAEISGRVKGELVIRERLVLRASARIDGNISTGKLVVEDGATFTGKCDMSGVVSPSKKDDNQQDKGKSTGRR